jgi:RHS repeat-associated protein
MIIRLLISNEFKLINMNGRLYDPVIGRMLSPDNNIQNSSFTQNYNRYSYCYNNPMKYTDPSGESVAGILALYTATTWVAGFGSGFFSTRSNRFSAGFKKGNQCVKHEFEIFGGLFTTDVNKNLWHKSGELGSRFSYQLPQTIGGFVTACAYNNAGQVNWVDYKYGSTVINTDGEWGAVTQGNFIVGDESIQADANNSLFQHEYGHYIQSQRIGLVFIAELGYRVF